MLVAAEHDASSRHFCWVDDLFRVFEAFFALGWELNFYFPKVPCYTLYMKNRYKLALDTVMAAVLIFSYKKNLISLVFHELIGLILCALVIIHIAINYKWIIGVTRGLFQKKTLVRTRICYLVDILLIITFLLLLITGIGISKKLFPKWAFIAGKGVPAHKFWGGVSLILLGIHIGLHWNLIRNTMVKKKLNPAVKAVLICLLTAAMIFGGYTLATSSISSWLSFPFKAGMADGHHGPGMGHGMGQGQGMGKGQGMGPGRMHMNLQVTLQSVVSHVLGILCIIILFAAITVLVDFWLTRRRKI